MKDSTIIIIVLAGAALLFWAVQSGVLRVTGGAIPVGPGGQVPGGAILAPQPSQNYSGYLAATTAPQVSGAINTALSGLSSVFAGWLSPKPGAVTNTNALNSATKGSTNTGYISAIGSSPAGPSLAAAPGGPSSSGVISAIGAGYSPVTFADASSGVISAIGPITNADTSYNATVGSAYDYSGLSAANSFDPGYSLMDSSFV